MDYAIVVNTHSSSKDVWPIFFGQLEKYFSGVKTYVFTDDSEGLNSKYYPILYNPNDKFRTQYLKSIKQVKEEFIIYLNEDYIIYNYVDINKITSLLNILISKPEISFIRLGRGPNITNNKIGDDLYYLSHNQPYFYSQTTAIWRKIDLEKIHEVGPDTHIGVGGEKYGHFEIDANLICKKLNLNGLIYYNNEPKRGKYHYDCSIFPYIATAIIKGKWNLSEYTKELTPLIKEYGININERGYI